MLYSSQVFLISICIAYTIGVIARLTDKYEIWSLHYILLNIAVISMYLFVFLANYCPIQI